MLKGLQPSAAFMCYVVTKLSKYLIVCYYYYNYQPVEDLRSTDKLLHVYRTRKHYIKYENLKQTINSIHKIHVLNKINDKWMH